MKKTIDLFFNEAPYWQVFIALFILISVSIFSFISFFSITEQFVIYFSLLIKLTITLSFILSIVVTLFIYLGRKSIVFWEKSKKLSCKINEAKTKKELEDIFTNDFQELRKISMGSAHNQELVRLYTIMDTKHIYIK